MWNVISNILGSGDTIKKGMDLIDDMVYTDQEEAEDKQKAKIANSKQRTQAKIGLMEAYAPFKIAQRYLALLFAIVFLSSYIMVLVMYFLGKPIAEVMNIMEMFNIGWIMMTIVMFYFGGGLADSIRKPTGFTKKEEREK